VPSRSDRAAQSSCGKRIAPFVAYLVLFYAAWIGWVYWVYPRLRDLGETTLVYAVANITLRLVIWVVPVFLYLKMIDHTRPLDYLKLRQHWKRGVLIGLSVTVINLLLSIVRFGMPHIKSHSITWNTILSTSLLIGFIEEITYRGFIFQKLQEIFSFWIATLLSSILFLLVHIPGWISLHMLRADRVIFVFAFGLLMVIIFRISKSLWAPITSHSLNDFLSAVVFRV
jgi:uncharacterized protein